MLILTRRRQDSISLMTSDGEITVKVVAFLINENGAISVRLGINAPQTVAIHRDDAKHKYTTAAGGIAAKAAQCSQPPVAAQSFGVERR